MTTTRKPASIAYASNRRGQAGLLDPDRGCLAAYAQRGINIELAALPLDARIILMPPKVEQASAHEVTS